MMKNKVLRVSIMAVLGLISVMVAGCSRDMDDEVSLMGEWVEESPVENRTELYFHSANRLTQTETGGASDDYFYRVVGDSIFLSLIGAEGESGETEHFFRQIDDDSFQIENLYPSIPEDETTYMIFRRKGTEESNETENDPE